MYPAAESFIYPHKSNNKFYYIFIRDGYIFELHELKQSPKNDS